MAWDKLFGRGGSAPSKTGVAESLDPAVASEPNAPESRRETRRSRRVCISMRVLVKCQRGAQAYEEQTSTEAVNAHGCLLRLGISPERGQTLTVVNTKSSAEAECRVVYVGQSEGGKTKVGVEFLQSAEYFWHIAFPPDDWTPGERKLPVLERPSAPQPQKRV